MLPAKGLFVGDQLSDLAKQRLTDLVIDALGLDVDVALLVPNGPWQILDPKRIVVESRIDATLKEPQLVVEMVGLGVRRGTQSSSAIHTDVATVS